MGLSNFLNRLAGLKTDEEVALEDANAVLSGEVARLEKEVDALKRENRYLRESFKETADRIKGATRNVFDVDCFVASITEGFK